MRSARRDAGWIAVALIGLPAYGRAQADPAAEVRPSVLLITLDTTRADRLGCYGLATARTPWLDAVAGGGARFTNAFCSAPITLPSHATILTGADPVRHGVHDNGMFRLADSRTTLAEALRASGWQTAAFVGSFVLDARFGLAQGFATYDGPTSNDVGQQAEVVERPASAVIDGAIAWLARARADRPVFLWVHLFDPHAPYLPPREFARSWNELYDGEIEYCDVQLARLHAALAERGRTANLIEVVTADHGEAFGAHGEATHGLLLHDATMRVPLLVRGPGVPAGAVVSTPVGNGAIAPTVLALLGLPVAELLPEAHHATLPFALTEGGPDPLPLLLETHLPYNTHAWAPLRGLVVNGSKLVSGSFDELFDLTADPQELHDIAAEQPEKAQALRRQLEERFGALRGEAAPANEIDEFQRRLLHTLGYTSSDGGSGDAVAAGDDLPDPRRAIADEVEQQTALAEFKEARGILGQDAQLQGADVNISRKRRQRGEALLESALGRLGKLVARHPKDPSLAFDLGNVLLSLERFAEAVPRFECAVRGDLRSAVRHYNLAIAYSRSQKQDFALAEMEKSAWLEPRLLRAYQFIVAAYDKKKDLPRAVFWLNLLAEADILPMKERAGFMQQRMRTQAKLEAIGQRPAPPLYWPPPDLRPEGDAVGH